MMCIAGILFVFHLFIDFVLLFIFTICIYTYAVGLLVEYSLL